MEWCMVTKYQSHLQWKLVLNGTNGRWLLVEINHELTRSFCWYVMSSKWRQSPCVSMNCCDAKKPGRGDKIQENRGDFRSRLYICISRFSVYHPIFPYYIHIIPMLYPCYTHNIWQFHHRQAFSPSWRWRWRLALRKSLVSKQRRRSFKPRWDRSQWRVALLVFA